MGEREDSFFMIQGIITSAGQCGLMSLKFQIVSRVLYLFKLVCWFNIHDVRWFELSFHSTLWDSKVMPLTLNWTQCSIYCPKFSRSNELIFRQDWRNDEDYPTLYRSEQVRKYLIYSRTLPNKYSSLVSLGNEMNTGSPALNENTRF